MNVNMDLTKFNELLDRHGPVLDAWPTDLQGDARSLLEASPEAADALADAQTLTALLSATPLPPAPVHLAG